MNIHYFLLTLGTASVLGLSAATNAVADTDSSTVFTESAPEASDRIMSVTPSINSSVPPTILIAKRHAKAKRSPEADSEKEGERGMTIVVSPNDMGAPVGIEFGKRKEPETTVAATGSESQIEFGAPSRPMADPLLFVLNASTLLETPILNEDDKALGTVQDFIVDKKSGRIELLAVGPGEKLRLIPPQALEPSANQTQLTLDVDESRWENAPSVSANELDQIALQEQMREVRDYYRLNEQEDMKLTGNRTAMHNDRPYASTTATRSEQPEQAAAEARGTLRQNSSSSSSPSLRQASRPNLTSRSSNRTPADPLISEQDEVEYGSAERKRAIADTQENTFRASEILGEAVEADGENFAHVSDLIADLHVGYLQHVIITRDDKEADSYAIPLQKLKIGEEAPIEFLDDPSSLDNAPKFDARMARLHRYEGFRYDAQDEEVQYGAPEREAKPAKTDDSAKADQPAKTDDSAKANQSAETNPADEIDQE